MMFLKSLLVTIVLFFWSASIKAQLSEPDSLLLVYNKAPQDSIKIAALASLATYYFEAYPDSSLCFARLGLDLAVKNNNPIKEAQLNQAMGVAYDYKGNLDSSLAYLNQSLKIYKQLHLPEKESHVISDIALAWFFRGNYELAIRNHLDAFELRKKSGNLKFISISMNNLGLVYKARKDYSTAINYYRQSLVIKEKIGDQQGVLNTTMNIGSLYQTMLLYDSSYYFAAKGLKIATNLNAKKDIASCKANMGDALLNLNRISEAIRLLEEAEEISIPLNHIPSLITIYHSRGNISRRASAYTEALGFYQKGLSLAAANKRQELMLNFTDKIALSYTALRQYDKALVFKDSSIAISARLLNEENLRQINEMTAVYQVNEKEKQIIVLDAEKEVASSLADRRKKERNYFIAASLLFLGLAVFAYKTSVANRKKNKQLDQKNLIIEEALSEKEILMKEIHHRVKNNLQVVSSLLSLQSDYIKDELAFDAVNESRNRVQSMALIHQNLYQENNLTGVDVQEYISKLCDNLFASYNIRPGEIKLIKEIEPLNLDLNIIVPVGLILNELFANSLKYGFDNSRPDNMIKVILHDDNGTLKLAVYDNGKGLYPNMITAETDSFGFKMINAFLKKLDGTMKQYNDEGARTEILIPGYKTT